MKKFLLVFVFISLFLSYSSSFASLSISPLKFEFDINSSSSMQEKIKVTNSGDSPITLYSSKEDFIAWDDSGTPQFIKSENQTQYQYSLSNWISIEDENITLAPNESKEIYFRVNVPQNAEPGWHYAAIFFSPGTPGWSQVTVVQRLWVLVLVNVPGEVNISGNVKSFQLWKKSQKEFQETQNFSDFPITFQTLFQNDGNVHLKPTGKITILDENAEVLKNIGKETLSSPAGAYIWEKMVDYIPINDTLWNVLPKSQRKFEIDWMGFGYNVLNDDGTKSVEFKNLEEYYADKASEKAKYLMFWQRINSRIVEKKLTAYLELSYEGKDKEKKEFSDKKEFYVTYNEKYVWVNYVLVWVLMVIILSVWVYFIKIAPTQRAKKEEEMKKRILEEIENSKK